MEAEIVCLNNGMFVLSSVVYDLHSKLKLLYAENGLRFWEISYLARHPEYAMSAPSLKDLTERGILGKENTLTYINQILILYLIVGRDRSLRVINDEELKNIISSNTP